MNTISKSWIQFAESDLDAAKRLFQSSRPTRWTFLLVLWHCHQAVEKCLKAVLIKQGKEILKIHDLPRLAELTGLTFSSTNDHLIKMLNKFYLRSRYPDIVYKPLPQTDREATYNLLQKTNILFLWLQQQ